MQDNDHKYEGNATRKDGNYGPYWGFGIKRTAVEEWLKNNPGAEWMNGALYPSKDGEKAKVRVFTSPKRG